MHSLSRELARDLNAILSEPSYIYTDSIEPDADRLPVPRFLILALIEALGLADSQLTTYRAMTRDLAQIVQGLLTADAGIASLPVVVAARSILSKVEEFNAR